MTIKEFNHYPKNLRLGLLGSLEIKTKQEWLQEYILNHDRNWESPEELIKMLIPTLL
jgi:hypothetical protein